VVVVSAIVFGVVIHLYRDTFGEAAPVTTALSTHFGIFGTAVGACFGITSSNDAHDKTRDELARANDMASRALAALPPSEGRRVVGLES
jgi:aspartate/tyrosine/aromatic aminotransferase